MRTTWTRTGELSRARYPDAEGYAAREATRIFYEVYGAGDRTIVWCPPGASCTRGCGRRRFPTSRDGTA